MEEWDHLSAAARRRVVCAIGSDVIDKGPQEGGANTGQIGSAVVRGVVKRGKHATWNMKGPPSTFIAS